MRLLKTLALALCLFGMAACSGSTSFNPEKCAQLEEKAKSGETLTEADYNEMIDQFAAAFDLFQQKQKEFGDDKQKIQEYFFNNEEGKALFKTIMGFGAYLTQHKDDLTAENVKKLEEIETKLQNKD